MTDVSTHPDAGEPAPNISIVAIGRNEGDRLIRCLKSIREAGYPQECLEIIYVDTASTDGSDVRAAEIADRVLRINPERPCAAAARNAGWRIARHPLVQFLDGDTVLDRTWLTRAADELRDPKLVSVYGRRAEVEPHRDLLTYWTHLDWRMPVGKTFICGGDVMFRRSVLEELNGYDETLIAGEEPDLCFRLTRAGLGEILSLDALMTTHDIGDFGFAQYWKRSVRTGHAYAEVAWRHRGSGHRFWLRQNLRIPVPTVLLLAAIIAALMLRNIWPVVAWAVLIFLQYLRALAGEMRRGDAFPWAARAALRFFVGKPPQFVGQLLFAYRHVTGRGRGRLMEYKAPARESNGA